jgi:hypothetical protein
MERIRKQEWAAFLRAGGRAGVYLFLKLSKKKVNKKGGFHDHTTIVQFSTIGTDIQKKTSETKIQK